MRTTERDRINRLLAAHAIGPGKRYYGRTIDGLIDQLKTIGTTNIDSTPLTIYCGSSNPNLFQRVPATKPDGTASFQYKGLRAFTEYKRNGGRYMVFCEAAFSDNTLWNSFPMSTAERNADFSAKPDPEDDIDYYSFSLTGFALHELHHALCDVCESLYYGTTELAYQVTSQTDSSNYQRYANIYNNADSCTIIAVSIWLRGSSWHRGIARQYRGMPGGAGGSKRSLSSLHDDPWREVHDQGIGNLVDSHMITAPAFQVAMGGPRLKSEGIDPTWFGLTPLQTVRKEIVSDTGGHTRRRRRILKPRVYGRKSGRTFVA
ncbi:MAG: hypothetical protein LQ352_001650 [Teloschistes flavicans]|nr:MAG: hypothetical protein LQ352_001650 [Teloschistes flavicans]